MYLKKFLNSFFEVNNGIERTTNNFTSKNESTYAAFENAAANNPTKYSAVRDKAYSIKNKADLNILIIQQMKYDLVSKCDQGIVYLGSESDIKDGEGNLNEDKAHINKPFSDLSAAEKSMPIGYLKNKSDRYASQDLFYPKKVGDVKSATVLKEKIEEL